MIGMTFAQQKALRVITAYVNQHRLSPTIADIAKAMGCAKTNAHRLVRCLEQRGYIRRAKHKARAIEIIPQTDTVGIKPEIREHLSAYAADHQISEETAANELLRGALHLT